MAHGKERIIIVTGQRVRKRASERGREGGGGGASIAREDRRPADALFRLFIFFYFFLLFLLSRSRFACVPRKTRFHDGGNARERDDNDNSPGARLRRARASPLPV